jgi:hypothetical protein
LRLDITVCSDAGIAVSGWHVSVPFFDKYRT